MKKTSLTETSATTLTARIGVATLSLVFLVSRLLFLDADIPPWLVSFYAAIDEFYYTIPAFNLYHYGRLAYQVVPLRDDTSPTNLLQIVMTFVTLRLFGNTYYGLRVASVIAAFGVFLLLFPVVKHSVARNDAAPASSTWTALFWLSIVLVSFPFLIAGRVAEPTIFRMLALCAVLYLCTLDYFTGAARPHRSAILGLAATASMIFVYIYNAFVPLGVFIAVVYWAWQSDRRTVWRHVCAYAAGVLAGVGAYAALVWLTYRMTLIEAALKWYVPWRTSARLPGPSLGSVPEALRTLLTTNIFRFNWALLFFFLLALPFFAYSSVKKKDRFGVAALALTGAFVAQSMFVNDYSYRKFVILLPLVIVAIATAFSRRDELLSAIGARRSIHIAAIAYTLLAGLGVCVLYWLYSHPILLPKTSVYRIETNKIVLQPFSVLGVANYLNLLSLAVAGALVGAYLMRTRWRTRTFAALAIVALTVPNLYLASRFVFVSPSFGYRDAMIAAGEQVDGKITAGGWSFAMRLYNTSRPVMNDYVWKNDPAVYRRTLKRLFDQGKADASFAYTDPETQARMAEIGLYVKKKYPFELRNDQVMGLYVPKARLSK